MTKVGIATFVKNYHNDSSYLLLRKEKDWKLPGGQIKYGESVREACNRTIFEETGVRVSTISKMSMGPLAYTYDDEHHIIIFMMARSYKKYEIADKPYKIKWFTKDQFSDLVLMEPIPDFLKLTKTSQELT